MKKTLLSIGAFFGLTILTFAQDPAGNSFLIDYDEFQEDGELHLINCGNDDSFNPGANMTIEAWLKPYSSEWNQKIAGKNNASFNSGYIFGMITGRLYTEIWTPTLTDFVEGFIPPAPVPYYWVHMAMVYDGTSKKGYINGELVGEVSATGDIAPNSNDFIIGIAPWGGMDAFQYFGNIDEMRVWNTARTEEEINNSMFIPLDGSETGLIAYYDFNASTGLALEDLSTNENDGTLSSNCDDSNWAPSRAVIGFEEMQTQNDVNGLWNASGFSDPRVVTTENGLSLLASNIPEDDYMVFGHDDGSGTSTADNPSDAPADMVHSGRVWYINNAGEMYSDLVFNLENVAAGGDMLDGSQPAENYTLLKRDGTTGEFVSVAGGDNKSGNIVTFSNYKAKNGYYAVAVSSTAVIDDDDASIGEYEGFEFGVFPNPATDNVVVSLPNSMNTSIEIYDAVGKIVLSLNGKNTANVSIEVSEIPAGIYTIIVTDLDNGTKGQKRIAIN